MHRNYEIADGIYLMQESYKLDLHNHFDFKKLDYSVTERKLVLSWERSSGDWVSTDTPRHLIIEFSEVSEFRFMPRDLAMPFTEDVCTNSFGYWVDEDWADGLIMVARNQKAEPHWLTAIEFMSGAVIAVQADKAYATVMA